MKKILAVFLSAAMGLSMAACGGTSSGTSSADGESGGSAPSESIPDAAPSEASSDAASGTASTEDGSYEIAMITDLGKIDDKSFNQGTWEGVQKYASEKGISHKYYQPQGEGDEVYLTTIELAVKGGAKVVVTPGFLFEKPIFDAQTTYPDVHFILLDGAPREADGMEPSVAENTVGFVYAEEQPGFLAGYAAVKEGYTKLGFLGGVAVPAVVRYGYGFVQGAEYAAKEMGLPDGGVTINYNYTGSFTETPEIQTLAASWYQQGTEVIFACGGSIGNSAMAAAEASGGKVIGVDVDQSVQSASVITSAMKNLPDAVYDMLEKHYAGAFPGGQFLTFSAKEDLVGLPMDTSKFEKFTQEDYTKIYDMLKNDTDGLASGIVKEVDASGNAVEPAAIPVAKVALNVI